MALEPPSLTLGVEEEYQILDPETRELHSFVLEDAGDDLVLEEVKRELHRSNLEIGTRVCATPAEVRDELTRLRGRVRDLAAGRGLSMAAAGTHPFSSWQEQEITPMDRYLGLETDYQDVSRRLLIFGMHVHVGIEDPDFRIDAMNVARYFMPHLLALTTSSPFWRGRETGLKSYRTAVWGQFPRSGVPRTFGSWGAFERLVKDFVETGCIDDGSKIYWDVRPHHALPTLEFRFADVCTRIEETVCIAALLQAIVARLWELRSQNLTFRVYPVELVAENKWRAARYGIDGRLVDFGKMEEVPLPELIEELIDVFLGDVLDRLGTRPEAEIAYRILEEGTSADRQLARYRETGDLRAVVDGLMEESLEGVD